jgi:hypothetical protein
MAYIILEWNGAPDTVSIILDNDGFPKLFNSEQEAHDWARVELAFNWKIVEIRQTLRVDGFGNTQTRNTPEGTTGDTQTGGSNDLS